MQNMKRVYLSLTACCLALLLGGAGWYFFGQKLMLSEVVGKQNDPYVTIALNLFDFDTGLTRFDVYTLSGKARRWKLRIQQIELMTDAEQQQFASAKLYADIISDSAARRVLNKIAPYGNEAVVLFFKSLGR